MPSGGGGDDARAETPLGDELGRDHGRDRDHQQREAVVEPGVDAGERGQRRVAVGDGEVESDEQTDERERLHARHAEAKEEIGGRRAERQHGDAERRDPRPSQHPDEREHHRERARDGGDLAADPEVADREGAQQHVVEHVVIGVAIRRQDRQRQPRKRRRKPPHARFPHHLRVLDVEVRVVPDQVRRRDLQPDEHEERTAQGSPGHPATHHAQMGPVQPRALRTCGLSAR